MKKIILVLLILSFKFSFAQTLPESRPADLKISYTVTKGLQNAYYNTLLSIDSCYYETIFQDITNRFTFILTSAELDDLYAVFQKYEINKISSKQTPRMAPERAGDNLLFQWGDNSMLIANSGSYMIDNNFLPAWRKIVKNVKKFVKVQLDERSKNFILEFDKTLIGKKVSLYLNDDFLYDNIVPMDEEQKAGQMIEATQVTLAAVPGTYYLKVVLSESGITQDLKIDIAENSAIGLTLNGNKISTW